MIAAVYAVTRLAALLVLLTPSSAWAECAWVLWEHVMTSNPSAPAAGEWIPSAAHKTQIQCEPHAEYMTQKMREKMGDRHTDKLGHEYLVEYVCLPDTVDPRGAKGSGR